MKKNHRSSPLPKQKTAATVKAMRRQAAPAPGPRDLAAIFESCKVPLTARQIDQLWTYHGLLRRHNSELNLTRVHNFANMVLKLYVDSVLPAFIAELPSPLMDLGSGPGMPGIPLKIMFPDKEIWLAEGRGKRTAFLEEALKALGLSKVRIIDRNITARFDTPVAGVITRAVETIARTLGRIDGCLVQGGKAIFMKGPGCDDEIEEALDRYGAGYRIIENAPYRIGHTAHERRLVIFQRLGEPPAARVEKAVQRHRVIAVSGPQNQRFKVLKKLLSGRGLKKSDRALIFGARPVSEMMARRPELCLAWITSGEQNPPPEKAPGALEWIQLAPPLFKTLDIFGTQSPLLLIRPAPILPWKPSEGFPTGCTLLVPFQDPENVGAVIRSAAAFGVRQIVLLAESAHPFHPKAVRAAAGTLDLVALRQGPALADLPDTLPIVALSAQGRDIDHATFPPAFGLLVGMEGPGLPAKWRDKAVRIPISPEVESLNAATAAALALYQWSQSKGARI